MHLYEPNINEIINNENYINNGIYYYDAKNGKLGTFYKYNSVIDEKEIKYIKLKKI